MQAKRVVGVLFLILFCRVVPVCASINLAIAVDQHLKHLAFAVAWNNHAGVLGAEGMAYQALKEKCMAGGIDCGIFILSSDSVAGHCLSSGYYVVVKYMVGNRPFYGLGAHETDQQIAFDRAVCNAACCLCQEDKSRLASIAIVEEGVFPV